MKIFIKIGCLWLALFSLCMQASAEYISGISAEVTMNKVRYKIGEPVTVRIRIKNSNSVDVTVPAPAWSNIAIHIHGHKTILASGASRGMIHIPGGSASPFYDFVIVDHQWSSALIPPSDYSLSVTYNEVYESLMVPLIVDSFRNDEDDKFQDWLTLFELDPVNQVKAGKAYLDKHIDSADSITYHVTVITLRGAARTLDTDLEKFVNQAIRKFGHTAELSAILAQLYWKSGELTKAVDEMARHDAITAIEWVEEEVSKEDWDKNEVMRAIRQLDRILQLPDPILDRFKATMAIGLYRDGDKNRAIEIIRPILPDVAQEWERSAGR